MAGTRRNSLRALASVAGFAVSGGLVDWLQRFRAAEFPLVRHAPSRARGILRPPGALPEPQFLSACIRCYRCQDACAPGAIQFYTEADGVNYHTPYVDPAITACTLCNRCGPACPTGALLPFEQRSDVDMGSVELREELCLSHKAKRLRKEQELLVRTGRTPMEVQATEERRGPCGECYMFCPLRNRAIRLEPGRFLAPIIDPENCVGCGMCEEICRVVLHGEPAIRVIRVRRPVGSEERA